jgi:hypothetical protein
VQRFQGGLVFKACRLLYHSTSALRVIKKRRKRWHRRERVPSDESPRSKMEWLPPHTTPLTLPRASAPAGCRVQGVECTIEVLEFRIGGVGFRV